MTHKPLIKICGVTDQETFSFLVQKGADLAGFIFYPPSPRYLPFEKARLILKSVKKRGVKTVGVFVNEDVRIVKKTARKLKLDYVQLHGGESDQYIRMLKGINIIRAVPVKKGFSRKDLENALIDGVSYILLDTSCKKKFGGTGRTFDWVRYPFIKNLPYLFLSGGLNEKNMLKAVRLIRPRGLDFNSGAEIRPGVKSKNKIKKILGAFKSGRRI